MKIHWFHRWNWRKPLRYNRRNHRKLLVVDSHHTYPGGFNIHRENSHAICGEERWRDTQVRITGSLVTQAVENFDAFWDGNKRFLEEQVSGTSAVLISNYSCKCQCRLNCIYADILHKAQKFVYLTTPYFVPDRRTKKGLVAAAWRGVDVRLLVPRKSEVRLTQWVARAAYSDLLRSGIRIL